MLERRRIDLERATREWEQARAESAVADDRRRAAAGQRVAHAAALLEEARAAHDRAAHATEEIVATRAALIRTLHTVEAASNETASTTSHTLAELDAKLVELEGDRALSAIQVVGTTIGVVAQSLIAGAQLGSAVTAPIHGAAGGQGTTFSQLERERAADLQQQWADHEDIRMENEMRRRRITLRKEQDG